MKIVDQINRRFPKAISVAATGFDKSWKPKADRISPRLRRLGGSWFTSNVKDQFPETDTEF
jgi:DNA polymerase V